MEHQEEPIAENSFKTSYLNGFQTIDNLENVSDNQSDTERSENSDSNSDNNLAPPSTVPDLLKVFQDLYNHRINAIDKNPHLNYNEKNAEKVVVLQQYIHQLQEQNDTFVSTMMELETEAQQRVKQMEKRLKSSAKTTMEAAININECEKEMRRLVKERVFVESLYHEMQQHLSSMKVENSFLRDQNFNLNHDVQALLHVINHARSTGHWEMNCVTFCEVTPEQVFGPVQSISNMHSSESPSFELHLYDNEKKNKVQNFPVQLPSSEASISKCISLPDIGNIYHFNNATQKSCSLDSYGNIQAIGIKLFSPKSSNCLRSDQIDEGPEIERCQSLHKKPEKKNLMRRGQSEPHLFMFGESIYVYRPCEPIKKASNIALHDDYESSLPPCQSIDLKFPTDDLNAKISDWTSFGKKKSYNVPGNSFFKDDETTSSCTFSEPDIDSNNKEVVEDLSEKLISTSVQTDKAATYSIGLQAIVKRDDPNALCNCFDPRDEKCDKKVLEEILKEKRSTLVPVSQPINLLDDINAMNTQKGIKKENVSLQLDVSQMVNTIQMLKESLVKAEDKAQAKEILISQLQGHLVSSVKEVELKDTALHNLEKKLDLSRSECICLKQQVCDINSEIHRILKDLDGAQMSNNNLKLKADAKEEKVQEVLSEVKVLQEQKSALMIQLDAQGDELEKTKEELQIVQHKAESNALQLEQQSQIIRNLQDALVQSKRAFDAAHQKLPISHSLSSNFLSETKSTSKTSIVDI